MIVGEGSERPNLEQLAHRLVIESNVGQPSRLSHITLNTPVLFAKEGVTRSGRQA